MVQARLSDATFVDRDLQKSTDDFNQQLRCSGNLAQAEKVARVQSILRIVRRIVIRQQKLGNI